MWEGGEGCGVGQRGGVCGLGGRVVLEGRECGVDAEYTVLVCYTHISVLFCCMLTACRLVV